MRSQEEIMQAAGYVTASAAAEAIGVDNIGTVHRMITSKRLRGARADSHWYVSVKSLLTAYKDARPILKRILALGVEPQDDGSEETAKKRRTVPPPPPKRGRNGKSARH